MVYIIAEAGVDHEGSPDRCLKLLDIAVEGRANAFKLQYFKKGMRGPSRELPWLEPFQIDFIQKECIRSKLDFICTPHDLWALEELERMKLCTTYKIGSGDWHLIDAVHKTGKSIIISTGMKDRDKVDRLFKRPHPLVGQLMAVLHCVSQYPCPIQHANLGYMKELIDKYSSGTVIGYSDHCRSDTACLAAVAMGANIIEKHITLERNVRGRQDTFCSLDAESFPQMVGKIREIEDAMINRGKKITDGEAKTLEWVERR